MNYSLFYFRIFCFISNNLKKLKAIYNDKYIFFLILILKSQPLTNINISNSMTS